jgi:carboxyl-terminal processing protease
MEHDEEAFAMRGVGFVGITGGECEPQRPRPASSRRARDRHDVDPGEHDQHVDGSLEFVESATGRVGEAHPVAVTAQPTAHPSGIRFAFSRAMRDHELASFAEQIAGRRVRTEELAKRRDPRRDVFGFAHRGPHRSAGAPVFALLGAFAVLAPVPGLSPLAAAGEAEERLVAEVWELVERNFHDSEKNGADWEALREPSLERARATSGTDATRRLIEDMLGELDASHCALLEPAMHQAMMAELAGKAVLTFGVLLEESRPGELHLRDAYEGGPAPRAGLLRGDRILALDGEDPFASPRLIDAGYDPRGATNRLYALEAGSDGRIGVVYQRERDGKAAATVLEAEAMSGVDALRRSARVVARDDLRIGIAHLWFCQRGAGKALREALLGELADCDAIVLDVRGRGGFTDVVDEVLALFDPAAKGAPAPRIPLVVLIDSRSRSAKEILAFRVRASGRGVLVGRRTEGAVLGAGFFRLSSGQWLELATRDVKVHGAGLEGVGVAPDVEVDTRLPHAAGRDEILERGLEVAAERARAFRRGPY